MLPSYFDYTFVHLRQKVRLRPELSPNFLSSLGPNPTRKARPDLQLWPGPRAQMEDLFFWLSPKFGRKVQQKYLDDTQTVPGVPCSVKLALDTAALAWLKVEFD